MLPMLPDLLANLLVAFLPDAMITSSVLSFSHTVRRVTTKAVSHVLVALSVGLPPLAAYFQPDMLRFRDALPPDAPVAGRTEHLVCLALAVIVEVLYFKTIFTCPGALLLHVLYCVGALLVRVLSLFMCSSPFLRIS
jgi:hypothetical protein